MYVFQVSDPAWEVPSVRVKRFQSERVCVCVCVKYGSVCAHLVRRCQTAVPDTVIV